MGWCLCECALGGRTPGVQLLHSSMHHSTHQYTTSGIICSHFKTNVWAISRQHSDLKSCFLASKLSMNIMNNTVAPQLVLNYGNLMFGYSHAGNSRPIATRLYFCIGCFTCGYYPYFEQYIFYDSLYCLTLESEWWMFPHKWKIC